MKKILIAGGAGFIGTNLIKTLLKNNDIHITVIDNLSTGFESNIKQFLKQDNFSFIHHDISGYIDIEADEIYNLACPASPDKYKINPIETFKTSVFGIYNLLNLANKYNAKIFQASTSEVYGNPSVHPQNEEYFGNVNFTGPRACYDEGKRAAETLMKDYHQKYGTKIKIARIFNTYGPNMDKNDGRVVSNFINQAINNEDITVYGDGLQTRSFCYIDDTVDGIIKLMNTNDDINYPINIGNPDEYTVLELAEKIIKITSSKSKIIFKELPKDDPVKRCPDITKARKILNWNPKTNITEGLENTVKYYKTRNNRENGI